MEKPKLRENNGSDKLMFPIDARLRNLTYFSPLFVTVEIKTIQRSLPENSDTIEVKELTKKLDNNICIGKIPIMVNSILCSLTQDTLKKKEEHKECKYDLGGYFIVSGSEKVIISQERTAENKIYVFKPS